MINVVKTDPTNPEALALLDASRRLMDTLFDVEENHYLLPSDLAQPDTHFFTARRDDTMLGTAALVVKDGYGELKAMFVAENARGQGVARALLNHVEDVARSFDLPWLRLETGDALLSAIKLYRATGFRNCGPFGDYEPNESSVFMEKHLA